jgi:hypothetical protein
MPDEVKIVEESYKGALLRYRSRAVVKNIFTVDIVDDRRIKVSGDSVDDAVAKAKALIDLRIGTAGREAVEGKLRGY